MSLSCGVKYIGVYRNSKQIQNTNSQMFKTVLVMGAIRSFDDLNFENSKIVSDFVLRISNFKYSLDVYETL